jgi:hypothetical protein
MRGHEYRIETRGKIRTKNTSAESNRLALMDNINVVTNHESRALAPFCIANLFMVTF